MQTFYTKSAEETEKLGEAFGKSITEPCVVAFTGSMGMGKTAFIRGAVRGLGSEDGVSSPTFALVHEYKGRMNIYHFDMYRVNSWDDLYSTGFFDYIQWGGVLLIEWSENIDGALDEQTIRIDISKGQSENDRIITIDGAGDNI